MIKVPLPGFTILIELEPPNRIGEVRGTIHSDLSLKLGEELEVAERLILAQAQVGMDVTTPQYISALTVLLEAILAKTLKHCGGR